MTDIKLKSRRIFAFSDTHGTHRQLKIPADTEILICAGDAVEDNLPGGEYDDFLEWFKCQAGKYKIFVPDNHELSFGINAAYGIRPIFLKHGIILMEDAMDDFDGITIGSISSNSIIESDDIPLNLDILVTHYPPFGILDDRLGSIEILNFVMKAKPEYHLFGHVHSTGGQMSKSETTKYINISI